MFLCCPFLFGICSSYSCVWFERIFDWDLLVLVALFHKFFFFFWCVFLVEVFFEALPTVSCMVVLKLLSLFFQVFSFSFTYSYRISAA